MGSFFIGLGLKALGGLRLFGQWLSRRSPLEILAFALIALLIVQHIMLGHAHADARSQKSRADQAEHSLAGACQAARKAAGNPKMDCKQLEAQILALGQSLANAEASIGRQNAAISELGATTEAEQKAAKAAVKAASGRAAAAEAAAQRLSQSSRQASPGGGCAPSKTLQEQWQ